MTANATEKVTFTVSKTPRGLTQDVRKRILEILKDLQLDTSSLEKYEKKESGAFRTKKIKEQYWQDLKKILRPLLQAEEESKKKAFPKEKYANLINELLKKHSKLTVYDHTEFRSARGLQNIGGIRAKVVGLL